MVGEDGIHVDSNTTPRDRVVITIGMTSQTLRGARAEESLSWIRFNNMLLPMESIAAARSAMYALLRHESVAIGQTIGILNTIGCHATVLP